MQEKPKQESIKNTNKQTKLAPLLLRGGAKGKSDGRGVFMRLAYQSRNTPLHPSQEGNRTCPRFLVFPS